MKAVWGKLPWLSASHLPTNGICSPLTPFPPLHIFPALYTTRSPELTATPNPEHLEILKQVEAWNKWRKADPVNGAIANNQTEDS
jgi:hypothetical protein